MCNLRLTCLRYIIFIFVPTFPYDMKHAIKARWLLNPDHAFSHLSHNCRVHINILFIIKVKILKLNKWSYMFSQVILTIRPQMVSMFWACSSHLFWTHTFLLVPVLIPTSNHIPLKYKWPYHCCVRYGRIYPSYHKKMSCLSMKNRG